MLNLFNMLKAAVAAAVYTLLLLAASPAQASSRLDYDRLAAPKQSALASLLARTVTCMRDAVRARLAGGERDTDAIAGWAAQLCGVPLGQFMVREMDFSERDAAVYLFAMAHAALDETPGVKRRGPGK